jgi:hypothetical protein
VLNNADVDYVEELLAGALNSYKFIVIGSAGKVIDLEECPYCGKAYSNNDNPKSCPHCSNPLEIICWNCGGKAPYTVKNSTCPTCGAAKDHNKRFDTITKKLDSLFVQAGISLDQIETELNNLKNLLPDYSKAGSSKLAKKITEYDDKTSKKKKEEETVGAAYKTEYEKIQELINLKKYFTAQGAVTALKNKYPAYNISRTDELSKTVLCVTTQVKQHADKAKTLVSQNNEDAAVSEIAAALDLSTDCIEAKQILSKFPPKTPENVNAALKENAAIVSWAEAKQQKMVTYTVIRKNGSCPTTIEDGTTVASELRINFFEDKSIVSDTPYFYAVYAVRLGINSSIAFSVSPVITYFDAINIRQEIVAGKIKVKWEAPVNVSEVEVIRKKGLAPPVGREDGQKITVKNNDSFEDTEYDKNRNSYLFVCIYKNEKTVKYSKGVTRHFKAFEELKPPV